MVVLSCAGAFPFGYCRSPRSLVGYRRTATSVPSTSKRLSYAETPGIDEHVHRQAIRDGLQLLDA